MQVYTWRVLSSYEQYSTSKPLSRSWLLANVPVAACALKAVAERATFLEGNRERHATLYLELYAAIMKWQQLAEAQLRVPFAVHEARQTGGSVTKPKTDMGAIRGLLTEMGALRLIETH
jgi:hypothetical protein